MNSNERRLNILYLLQSGKKITSKTLMEKFSISKRTVFRDLRVIQNLGVPVTYYPDYGYGVLRDGMIPSIMFTFRELSVILMGLSFVKSQIDNEMVNDAENVILKIRSSIPEKLQKQMNMLENSTLVSPYINNVRHRLSGGDWFAICSAFADDKAISFMYVDRLGNRTKRTITPHLLVYFTDHWNVIGYCHDRNTLRNFTLERMGEIVPVSDSSRRSSVPSLDDMLYGRVEENIHITIKVAQKKSFSLLSQLPGKIVSQSLDDESCTITFLFDDLDFINEWLLGFGTHVTICKPRKLIIKRKKLLEALLSDI